MGRQVTFYATTADESEFVRFIRGDADAKILPAVVPVPAIEALSQLPALGTPFWFTLMLWNNRCNPPVFCAVRGRDYYSIDSIASEVIEFSRSYFAEGELVRGRIWAEMVGWRKEDPSVTFDKSDVFKRWFNRLAGWIRRKGEKNAVGDLLLPGALEFVRAGGKIVQTVLESKERIPGEGLSL